MREIWTAKEKKDDKIIFEIIDEQTQEARQEELNKDAIPIMFTLGGYPPQMGAVMLIHPLPWRFRKVGFNIYIDGPSVGVEGYHPIDDPAE